MFFKKHETEVVLYSFEVEDLDESSTPDEDESTTSGNHCAWCGDPPDRYGSHGICAYHAAQMAEQAAARRRSRGRS